MDSVMATTTTRSVPVDESSEDDDGIDSVQYIASSSSSTKKHKKKNKNDPPNMSNGNGTKNKKKKGKEEFNYWTASGKTGLFIFLFILQLFDMGSDIGVARFHWEQKSFFYFALTIFFIIGPAVIMTRACFRQWYLSKPDDRRRCDGIKGIDLLRFVFTIFLVAPFLQRAESIYYSIKRIYMAKRWGKMAADIEKIRVKESVTMSTTLALYEAFMESAPQAILLLRWILADRGFIQFFKNSANNYTRLIIMVDDSYSSPSLDGPVKLPFFDNDSSVLISLTMSILSLVTATLCFRRVMVLDKEPSSSEAELPTCHPVYYTFWWHLVLIGIRIFAVAKASVTVNGMRLCISILSVHCVATGVWLMKTKSERLQAEYQNCPVHLLIAVHLFTFFFTSQRDVTNFTFCKVAFTFLLDVILLILVFMVENAIFIAWDFLNYV